ncbi:hypothetical protein ABDD95_09635 [Mucilaginibacter sp. PAMB04274]|uniref:hypothetical protein n=1 Tax=Mucilaginibacter sp. PAMB04274 TaxID=3138568 RepID=UPI0031F66640
MSEDDLPTYAIVELLIRLGDLNPSIGNYKDHFYADGVVMVKTSTGFVRFPSQLVFQQFNAPELITADDLNKVAQAFQ